MFVSRWITLLLLLLLSLFSFVAYFTRGMCVGVCVYASVHASSCPGQLASNEQLMPVLGNVLVIRVLTGARCEDKFMHCE